ncbi:hypothetical protein K450DRAFT_225942 [Umbelopsis ramanniana AG]|uniref:P-type ATPase A domain-containing protein n=1 Tax=Umbelopsis ramanniana AG TaxID=1314678 RepID=A0AAD5HHF4_UMBRA|nr:uncharacterized protein K450DRAFT_225942 [Umbelopsis ramanniana AG]KAI8583019.1 hypothetical protein K450DRAFT_225942 [Umbelopsis ramanniana AG]
MCPTALAPTCPSGQQFCMDGTCQASCDGIENACLCGGATGIPNYIPCAAGQLVNITHYDPHNTVTQSMQSCASAASINSSSVGVWGDTTTPSNEVWLECPIVPDPTFTWTEPMWIAVWTIMCFEAVLLGAWHIFKHFMEASFRRSIRQNGMASNDQTATVLGADQNDEIKKVSSSNTAGTQEVIDEKDTYDGEKATQAKTPTSDVTSDSSTLDDSEKLKFRGFRNNILGTVGFLSCIIITILFLTFLGCVVGDYYGTVDGTVFGVFLASDLSSDIFAAVWHIGGAWFVMMNLTRHRMRNYFRLESFAHESPYVQIEKKEEQIVFLDDSGKWMKRLQAAEQHVKRALGFDILVFTSPTRFTANGRRYFEFQCVRYVYNPQFNKFAPYEFDLGITHEQLHSWANGNKTDEANYRYELIGPNIISVQVPSIPRAVLQEFTHLLYIYQMMCMWVWYYFQYYILGLIQTGIILVSAFIKVALRLQSEHRIKKLAEYKNDVTVLRDGKWQENVCSSQLVPGDVFEVEEKKVVPCDAVILSGDVVVNESSLTGEALPVRKVAIPNDNGVYDSAGSGKTNTLFSGTIIAQLNPGSELKGEKARVTALVVRTGLASEKGMLIHKILFPTPVSFIFNEQLKAAICILLIWGLVAFALSLYLMGRGNITSWFYGVFVISQIFSPLLNAAFTINQSVCAARLRRKKILCLDLPRINLAGKVRIFCFDKTGTLTREGLEFYGGVPVTKADDKVQFTDRSPSGNDMHSDLARGIATCHAVTKVGEDFIGNPVDIESFTAMGWTLERPDQDQYIDTLVPPAATPAEGTKGAAVHVLKRFEFVHARACQSVAVLDSATNHVHVYVKGSFERIKQLSVSQSIPADYDAISARYAQEGCYVLALAHRDLGVFGQDIDMDTLNKWNRDELEYDTKCDFIGFVLFRNMLKEDTAAAIAELKEGDTRTVMITGDTALTGIFIARQCGMIGPGQKVLLGDAPAGPRERVQWRDVDTGADVDVDEAIENCKFEPLELAVTGRAFDALIQQDVIRKYLLHTRVFARMTPTDKIQCVQYHMEKGVTGMCGDGGNDCGALRAAHVGLALSEAEASIVSPFSTSNRSVMQCVELLRQGRSALATSFANYKFLILYGECMGFWELFMFYFGVIAPQPVWITIDGFITPSMTFAITQALPAKKLGPRRPTAKVLGPYVLASLLGTIFINFWFLAASVIWLFQQDWFLCNEFDSTLVNTAQWWLLGDSYESEIISLVILFQFWNNGALVNFGSAFRQAWWRNYLLVFVWSCFFISTSYITLADPNPYGCIFRINCGTAWVLHDQLGYPMPDWYIEPYNSAIMHNVLPKYFRWQLWVFLLANCAANAIWERVIVQWIGRKLAIRKFGAKHNKNRVTLKL